jgi:hypothetical protein
MQGKLRAEEEQGRQDSNLQPPVLETSSEARRDAGLRPLRGTVRDSRRGAEIEQQAPAGLENA